MYKSRKKQSPSPPKKMWNGFKKPFGFSPAYWVMNNWKCDRKEFEYLKEFISLNYLNCLLSQKFISLRHLNPLLSHFQSFISQLSGLYPRCSLNQFYFFFVEKGAKASLNWRIWFFGSFFYDICALKFCL